MLPRATSRAVYSFVTQSPDTQDIAISLVLEQPTVEAALLDYQRLPLRRDGEKR